MNALSSASAYTPESWPRAERALRQRRAANARTATAASLDPDGIAWARLGSVLRASNSPNSQSFSESKKEISTTVFAQVHFLGFTK